MKPIYLKVALPLIVGLVLLILPPPAGLTPGAWTYFALFAAVVVGLITEPVPAAAVGFIGVTVATVLGLVDPDPTKSLAWGLAGFSNGTVWLIFAAFMFALGYQKTGLGKRLGLGLVKLLGKRTLGLGYAVAFSDLILAPFMPSNTARSGGTLFPIIRNIPALYGSEPGPTSRKVGFTTWIGTNAAKLFAGASPVVVMLLLVVVFFVTHYMFASVTAHVTAMLPVFLAAGAAIPGMNVTVLSLMLVYSLGIMGIITPYATGPSPVYYGSGYVPKKDFWLWALSLGRSSSSFSWSWRRHICWRSIRNVSI